jgi:hypothetical protein
MADPRLERSKKCHEVALLSRHQLQPEYEVEKFDGVVERQQAIVPLCGKKSGRDLTGA